MTALCKPSYGTDFALQRLREEKRQFALITDETIRDLFDLKDAIVIPAGEEFKTRETKAMIENELLKKNYGRDLIIIGMGGGVVSDISGFVAATYLRGVPHIQIPTTLVAMVDASVGGKTGVNTPFAKNSIGAIHPAEELWVDSAFLTTLPESEIQNGMAEILKIGLLADPELFEGELPINLETVQRALELKMQVVADDPDETLGSRRMLNLGHTFAHGFEMVTDYAMSHGHAVRVGIRLAAFISFKMGLLPQNDLERIEEVLGDWKLSRKFTLDELMPFFRLDKKAKDGVPRFVLLKGIGAPATFNGEYCSAVPDELIEEALNWI